MSQSATESTASECSPSNRSGKRDRQFLPAARFARSQILHFLVVTVLPATLCAFWFFYYPSLQVTDVLLWIGMWSLTGGLGISLGYHRYYTHGGFTANPVLESAMALAGSMAGQGPVTYWVTLHRCHHQHSDRPFDPHSPQPTSENPTHVSRLAAFFYGHVGWVLRHDVPSPVYFARDLLRNPRVQFYDRTYWYWLGVGIVLPGLVAASFSPSFHAFLRGCVFGGLIRILVGNQIIWAINSVCHANGSHEFETRDSSRNNLLLALPAFGEGWHNNHHAFPWSARFGLRWWQVDLGWWALLAFRALGLASQLKEPRVDQVEQALKT